MDLRKAPLKLVTSRSGYYEHLECGHRHKRSYRQAKKRRCGECATELVVSKLPVLTVDTVGEASDKPRCVYCHDDLDSKLKTCNKCKASIHLDCASELRSSNCLTFNCTGKFVSSNGLTVTPKIVIAPTSRPVSCRENLLSRLWNWFKTLIIKIKPRKDGQ